MSETKPISKQADAEDLYLRVNRNVPAEYPNWVVRLLEPALQTLGPRIYKPATLTYEVDLSQFLASHPKPTVGEIYRQIVSAGKLESCLSYHDGLGFLEKRNLYRTHFGGSRFQWRLGNGRVPLWRSGVVHKAGTIYFPYLIDTGAIADVGIGWAWAGDIFHGPYALVRFKPNPMSL